jgi:hypothetical protein
VNAAELDQAAEFLDLVVEILNGVRVGINAADTAATVEAIDRLAVVKVHAISLAIALHTDAGHPGLVHRPLADLREQTGRLRDAIAAGFPTGK